MFVAEYRCTMAGAAVRLAQRRMTLVEALPEPEPEPVPEPRVVPFERRQFFAWPKPEKPAYIAVEPLPKSSPRQVITRVLGWHPRVTVEDVTGKSRTHPVIAARFDAIVAVYENCRFGDRHYSLPELGRVFGGRDHTTILSALRRRGHRPLDQRQGPAA